MSKLGIDLAVRKREVDCLVLKFHGRRIRKNGWEEQDALAEVYLAIEIRNHGKCPFDERKSSFGHYVLMVANQTLSRMFARETMQRRAKASAATPNARRAEVPTPESECSAARDVIVELAEQGKGVSAEVAWFLAQGCSLIEVAVHTGWSYKRVKEAARLVREEAEVWAEG